MTDIKIRNLQQDDWRIYQSIRLKSLKESPDSFGATYEYEASLSNDVWQARCQCSQPSKRVLPLIAHVDGLVAGLAWAVVDEADRTTANVYQMWVSPKVRGQGIGRSLLEHIILWSERNELKQVILGVTTSNHPAVSLYQSAGFETSGRPEKLREGSVLEVQTMVLQLAELAT